MKLARVEERPDLIKDISSGAILSVDKKAAQEYREKKALLNTKREAELQMDQVREKLAEIDSLKNDLNEIKSLLKEIVNR